jgi:hypothetical protein
VPAFGVLRKPLPSALARASLDFNIAPLHQLMWLGRNTRRLNNALSPRHAYPAYWARFVVVGGGDGEVIQLAASADAQETARRPTRRRAIRRTAPREPLPMLGDICALAAQTAVDQRHSIIDAYPGLPRASAVAAIELAGAAIEEQSRCA